MRRLYLKSELVFSLILIGLYVFAFSLADNLSQLLGTEKLITAPVSVVFTVILLMWVKKGRLLRKYGLCRMTGSCKSYLYFIPLILIASCNFWNGFGFNLSPAETVFYILSMICVGFIEELIFRGFLFRAICKDSPTLAIIISSATFGFGHIVNLLNGAELLATSLQIIYATAVGFAFTVLFYRGGSLIPCIITHSLVNATSVFCAEGSDIFEIISAAVITVISILYGIFILIKTKGVGDAEASKTQEL